MTEQLEALLALAEHRRMSLAAMKISVSQPTMSKRIAALEKMLGKTLIEHQGRNVVLTPYAEQVVAKIRPLMTELRYALLAESAEAEVHLSLSVSLAILDSWGADVIAAAQKRLPQIKIDVRTIHSSLALLSVKSGESIMALVYGQAETVPDLTALPLFEEPIVIIPSGLRAFSLSRTKQLSVMTIEANSETAAIIERRLSRISAKSGLQVVIERRVQTFSAIAQMAKAGLGHGIVPLGIAKSLRIPERTMVKFPKPGINVPVSLIARKTTFEREMVKKFCTAVQTEVSRQKLSKTNPQ